MCDMGDYYIKRVKKSEYDITILAATNNIAPTIAYDSFDPLSTFTEIKVQMYPETLADISEPQRYQYYASIVDLVQRLHQLGYNHGDLSEDNIVLNRSTGDVKLIDFGMSYELTPARTKLAELEIQEVAFICGVSKNFHYS